MAAAPVNSDTSAPMLRRKRMAASSAAIPPARQRVLQVEILDAESHLVAHFLLAFCSAKSLPQKVRTMKLTYLSFARTTSTGNPNIDISTTLSIRRSIP